MHADLERHVEGNDTNSERASPRDGWLDRKLPDHDWNIDTLPAGGIVVETRAEDADDEFGDFDEEDFDDDFDDDFEEEAEDEYEPENEEYPDANFTEVEVDEDLDGVEIEEAIEGEFEDGEEAAEPAEAGEEEEEEPPAEE